MRSRALGQLDAFIAALLAQDEADWQGWALALSEAVVDSQADIPVRMPFFRRVLFPALYSSLKAGSGPAARWLAGFSHLLHGSPQCSGLLPPGLRTGRGLIEEALRRDASDVRAKRSLRLMHRDRFDYAFHEIPCGILYDHNGASADECLEMMEELNDYRRLCAEIGAEDADRQTLAIGAWYIPACRDYLLHRNSYDSFAAYIEMHVQEGVPVQIAKGHRGFRWAIQPAAEDKTP